MQHQPYLDDFNKENGTHLVSVGGIHYEPFGIYPGTKASLDDLEDGDVIAVPNDTTNEARALLLLEANGVITLKEGAGLTATIKDIESYNKKIEIEELEAAQVSRVKDEAAQTYVNIITVKEGNENNEGIKALVDVLKSDEIKDYINNTYDGAVIPFE